MKIIPTYMFYCTLTEKQALSTHTSETHTMKQIVQIKLLSSCTRGKMTKMLNLFCKCNKLCNAFYNILVFEVPFLGLKKTEIHENM